MRTKRRGASLPSVATASETIALIVVQGWNVASVAVKSIARGAELLWNVHVQIVTHLCSSAVAAMVVNRHNGVSLNRHTR